MTLPTTTTPYFTIDAPSSRDLDDAIFVSPEGGPDGGWLLHVAIATPALEVPRDSAVDRQARAIAATVYSGTNVRQAMLPPELSEDRCTLQAGGHRNALQALIRVRENGEAVLQDLTLTTIRVAHRLAYEDVPRLARQETDGSGPMQLAVAMSEALYDARRRGGALVFRDTSRLLYLDEEGVARQAASVGAMAGHLVVQESMILANRLIAQWALQQDVPFLYRNHRQRLAAPEASVLSQQILVDAADSIREFSDIAERLRLLMGAAQYGATADGHYALHLPQYAHCTSPLRRYADLVNQRQVIDALAGRTYTYSQGELAALSEEVNATLAQVKEDRSQAMKEMVRRRAGQAISRGQLERLGAPEIVQALKMGARAGDFDPQFSEFVGERLQAGTADLGNFTPPIHRQLVDFPSRTSSDPKLPELTRSGKNVGNLAS